MAQAFDLAGITAQGMPGPSRSWRRAGTTTAYATGFVQNGHLVAEEPLQPANTAVTVYWKNGKVAVTDGPYAETKEQLGGIQVLTAV